MVLNLQQPDTSVTIHRAIGNGHVDISSLTTPGYGHVDTSSSQNLPVPEFRRFQQHPLLKSSRVAH